MELLLIIIIGLLAFFVGMKIMDKNKKFSKVEIFVIIFVIAIVIKTFI